MKQLRETQNRLANTEMLKDKKENEYEELLKQNNQSRSYY